MFKRTNEESPVPPSMPLNAALHMRHRHTKRQPFGDTGWKRRWSKAGYTMEGAVVHLVQCLTSTRGFLGLIPVLHKVNVVTRASKTNVYKTEARG